MIEIALQPFYWNLMEYAHKNPNGCKYIDDWLEKQYSGAKVINGPTSVHHGSLRFERDSDATAFVLRWS